jgi:lipopolysaccharide transport system permease protein
MNLENDLQEWQSEIKSKDKLLSINIKEVWQYRDLLFMLVKKDYVTFYKQTILGPIWFFVQPILTTIIYVLLFGQIAKLSTDGTPQIAFYMAGITIWNYFSEVLTKTSTVFKDSAHIMGKVYFPRIIMPLSIVVSGLIKFTIQFALFVTVVLYFTWVKGSIQPNLWILATPLTILLMAGLSLGLGMFFSSLTTKYKDLVFLLNFGIQLFMYASPVIYSISSIPDRFKWVINANPLTGIIECFRYGFLGSGSFDPFSLVISTVVTIILLFLGVVIFNKVEKTFMDTV